MVVAKGKQPTKGARQIVEENAATVKFYQNMGLAGCTIHILVMVLFYYENLTALYICLNIFSIAIYIGCYQMMVYISRPTYNDTNQILDSGLDLNMEGAMGEHIKDIVILTTTTHVLAVISNYFWLLLLLLPIRAMHLVWTNFLGPWFFQEAPESTEQDDKKRKKMERRMKRMQQ